MLEREFGDELLEAMQNSQMYRNVREEVVGELPQLKQRIVEAASIINQALKRDLNRDRKISYKATPARVFGLNSILVQADRDHSSRLAGDLPNMNDKKYPGSRYLVVFSFFSPNLFSGQPQAIASMLLPYFRCALNPRVESDSSFKARVIKFLKNASCPQSMPRNVRNKYTAWLADVVSKLKSADWEKGLSEATFRQSLAEAQTSLMRERFSEEVLGRILRLTDRYFEESPVSVEHLRTYLLHKYEAATEEKLAEKLQKMNSKGDAHVTRLSKQKSFSVPPNRVQMVRARNTVRRLVLDSIYRDFPSLRPADDGGEF